MSAIYGEWAPSETDVGVGEVLPVVDAAPLSLMCFDALRNGGNMTVIQRNSEGKASVVHYTTHSGEVVQSNLPGDWSSARYGIRYPKVNDGSES